MRPEPNHRRVLYCSLTGFVVMACIGWTAGSGTQQKPTTNSATVATGKSDRTRNVRERGLYRVPEYASAQVRAIREAGSTVDQMRATIALVNALPIEDLEKWLEGRWFDDAEGYNLSLFNKVATERWLKNDPAGYIAWNTKSGGSKAYQAARNWAMKDPDAALAYLDENPNPNLELGMLPEIAKTRPDLALARLQSLAANPSINAYQVTEIFRSLTDMGEASLLAAIEKLPDSWKLSATTAIQESKLLKSFSSSLESLMSDPDATRIFQNLNWGNPELCSQLLSHLDLLNETSRSQIATNPYRFLNAETAESWITADLAGMGFTPEQTNRLRMQAISELPTEKALLALNQITDDPKVYENALRGIFSRHRDDPKQLERYAQMLTDDADRQIALGLFESAKEASQKSAEENLPGVAEVKATRDQQNQDIIDQSISEESKTYIVANQLQEMSSAQSKAFLETYQTLTEDRKIAFSLALIDYSQSSTFPQSIRSEMLVDLIESNDPKIARKAVESGSSYALSLLQNNPADAVNWASKLQDSESKTWVQKNIAYNWALHDPEAARQWVKSLPSANQAEVQKVLDGPSK